MIMLVLGRGPKKMKRRCKWMAVVLFFLICTSLATPAVSGEIYKWTDQNGNVVFSDTPPPPGAKGEVREFTEDVTETSRTRGYSPKPKNEGIHETRPYKEINVIMYMTAWCPYCDKARNYLRSLNVKLIEYNIEQDKSKKEEMLSKSGGSKGVPLIDIEGIIIRGYSPDAIKTAVERRRNS